MKKAIMIMDMPENCNSCPFLEESELNITDLHWCPVIMQTMTKKQAQKRDEECPFKSLPEKKIVTADDTTAAVAIKYGWNNCLDEILREKDQGEV